MLRIKVNIEGFPQQYCVTPQEAIDAAAKAGITLIQRDQYQTDLVDSQGQYVSWYSSGNTLYLCWY